MKNIIRLSLLMILIPLLFLNVYAEESSIDNDSTQNTNEVVQGKTKMQEVIELLPEEYSLDNQEEDYFITEENGETKVETALGKEINTILEENNIDKESVDVLLTRNRENNTINSFVVTIADSTTDEMLEKNITVKYKNKAELDQDTKNQVEDYLKDKNSINLLNSYDFYTLSPTGEEVFLDDYVRNTLSNGLVNCYYQDTLYNGYFFSAQEEGTVYVFVNGNLYKGIPATEKRETVIRVTEDIEDKTVLEEARKELNDKNSSNIPENGLHYDESSNVVSNSTQESFGKLVRETVPSTTYEYVSGANTETNVTNPSVAVTVNGNHNKILGVQVNGVEVKPEYYELSDNNQITFTGNFLKALAPGQYSLVVKYIDGNATTNFTLKEERVEPSKPAQQETRPTKVVRRYYYYQEETKVEEPKEEVKEEKEEEKKEEDNILLESKEVSKDKEVKKTTPKTTTKEETKQEEKKPINFVPFIIALVALVLGGVGFFVFRKSQEEE